MTRNTTRTIRAIILATLMLASVFAMNVSIVGAALADQGTTLNGGDELPRFDVQPPDEYTATESDADDISGVAEYWGVMIQLPGEEGEINLDPGAAEEAGALTQILWQKTDGTVVEVPADSTSRLYLNKAEDPGNVVVYYHVEGMAGVTDGWYTVTAEYDSDGELTSLNGQDVTHLTQPDEGDGTPPVSIIGGGDYETIQNAIDEADEGETIIIVEDGTYSGFLLQKNVTVTAAAGVDATIDADEGVGSDGRVIDVRDSGGDADGATISNLTVDATGQLDYTVGVSVSADNVTVRNVTVLGDDSVTGIQTQTGYDGDGAENVTVAGNSIEGANVGVSIQGANNTVTDNAITGAILEGIGVAGEGHTFADNNVSTVDDAPGIRLYGDDTTVNGETDEIAQANELLSANENVASVAFDGSGATYDGSIRNTDTGTTYATIQAAVDAAGDDETIQLAAGTYTEQVTITESLTLVGAGEGETVIESPSSLDETFTKSNGDETYPVLTVKGADADVRSLTVDGANQGDDNNEFFGVLYADASGTVSNVTVRNVMNAEFSGVQHGIAVAAYNTDGKARTFTLRNSTLVHYQKGGFVGDGDGLTAHVVDSTVTGAGPTDVTGQNGIQISGSAVGVIEGNDVSGHAYTPGTALATNVLLYGHSADETTVVSGNTLTDGMGALAVSGSDNVEVEGNEFVDNTWHLADYTGSLDTAALLDANEYDAAAYAAADGETGASIHGDLLDAVDAAEAGDTVHVANGTYTLDARLEIPADGITIEGESQDSVVIDASGAGWPIYAENKSDIALRNLTIYGTQADGSDDTVKFVFVDGLTIENVAVNGSAGNEFDLNNVRNATLRNVQANGEDTGGVGIALSGVENATLDDVDTSGNNWGGVGLYDVNPDVEEGAPADWEFIGSTSDVTVTAESDLSETVSLYADQEYDGTLGDLYAPAYEYAVENPDHRERGDDFVFFTTSKEDAVFLALELENSDSSTIRSLERNESGEIDLGSTYFVREGMSIQTAVDAADDGDTVHVGNGDFEENVVIDSSITFDGDGTGDTVIAPSSGHPISVQNLVDGDRIKVDNVTVTDLTLRAPDGSIGLITVSNNDGDHETGTLTVEDVVVEGGDASFGLFDTEQATFENVVVRDVESDAGAFEIGGVGDLTIRNSLVEDSSTGVKINDFTELGYEETGTVTIEDTTFAGNDVHVDVTDGIDASAVTMRFNTFGADGRSVETAIGVRNAAAGELNATHNYWGSPNGPTTASNSYNVDSQGSEVVGEVDYAPWLDAPIDESPTLDAPVENTRTHEEYASIQAAVDDAAADDVLVANAGTYDESVTIATDNLTLVGEDGATIRGTVGFAHLAFTDGVSIQSFTFTDTETAIDANNAGDDLTVVDNEFVDVTNAVIHGGQTGGQDHVKTGWVLAGNDVRNAGTGFRLWNVGDLVVADNDFENISGSAVSLVSVDGATVTGNAFTDTTKAGVFVEGPFTAAFDTGTEDILVVDNTFSNAGANDTEYPQAAVKVGEFLADRDEVTVEENSIVAFRTDGLYVQESAVDATGTVDATHNYWGAPSGPSGEFDGNGANVTANVTVEPFYVGQSRQTLSKAVNRSAVQNDSATVTLGDENDEKTVRVSLPSGSAATSVTVTEADAPTGDATDPGRNVATYLDIDAGDSVEGNVSVSVTVKLSTLENAEIDPSDAVILHFTDGNWTELETVATVNGDQVTLEATSDGLSPFAVAQGDASDDDDDAAPGRSDSRGSDGNADAPRNRVSTTLLGGQAHARVSGLVSKVSVFFADGGTGGTVTVEALDARPDSIPAIPNANGFTYVDVSVPNGFENSEATLEFTVDATAVGDADASDLAVYHYHDGEWSTLETSVVSENGDEVVLEATTPGFSVFAVGSADGSGAATSTDEPADQSTDEPADEGTNEPTDGPSDDGTDEPADESTDDPVEELGGFNVGLLLGVLLLVAIVGAIAYVRIGQE